MKHADGTDWVCVPKVATGKMLIHGLNHWDLPTAANATEPYPAQVSTYRAMLAAAPAFVPEPRIEDMATVILMRGYARGDGPRTVAKELLRALGIGGDGE